MSRSWTPAFSIILFCLTAFGCQSATDQNREKRLEAKEKQQTANKKADEQRENAGPPRYTMELRLVDLAGHFRVKINGFPVEAPATMVRMSGSDITSRFNTALIGEGNKASLSTMPFLTRGNESLSIGTVEMRAKVLAGETPLQGARITEAQVDSAYKAWSKRASEQWDKYLKWEKKWLQEHPDSSSTITARDGGALDSMRQWTARNPMVVSTRFDNEAGPDFSRIFEEAPRLPDTPATRERLKDYAMHLRDLMARKDTAAMVEEFRPAIEGRYQTGTRLSRSEFMEANRQAVVVEDVVLDFERSDLRVRRWCEGRVWRIWREEAIHRGLFQDPSGGGIGKIYVGRIDGELKVVRQG